MSGVCGNWIKKFQVYHSLCPVFGAGSRQAQLLLTNLHLPNFIKGGLYQGKGKTVCVPGLNCYSCPAASGACPIGAFQAVAGSSRFRFSYYVTGFLILLGVLLGRFICGFYAPSAGFRSCCIKFQRKSFPQKAEALTYLKYVVLLVMVVLLPALVVNDVGMGDPFSANTSVLRVCWRGRSRCLLPIPASGRHLALFYMEIHHFDGNPCTERTVLSPFL